MNTWRRFKLDNYEVGASSNIETDLYSDWEQQLSGGDCFIFSFEQIDDYNHADWSPVGANIQCTNMQPAATCTQVDRLTFKL